MVLMASRSLRGAWNRQALFEPRGRFTVLELRHARWKTEENQELG